MKEKLPHSQASLILGIFSIITCWCYGIFGIILGIIGLVQGNKAIKIHNEDPDVFTGVGDAKAGKIMSIIGISLSVLVFIMIFYIVSQPGFVEEFQKGFEEAQQNQ